MEYLLDYVNLSDWKTKSQVLESLIMQGFIVNERGFRRAVKSHNQKFYNHETNVFIVHSSKGYKKTTDTKEILESIADNHKRALDMLYEEARIKKAIGENYNMKLIIDEKGFMIVEG